MKTKNGLFVAAVVGLLSQGIVGATSIFVDRTGWLNAVGGVYWDVDLGGAPNGLTSGGTLAAGTGILLPPAFAETLSFDSDLRIQTGAGWNNYINPGGGDPFVLATDLQSLTGTFSLGGFAKFGFELLPAEDSTITLSLSDGTTFSTLVDAQGNPQFFGWIAPDGVAIDSFTITSDHAGFLVGNFVIPDGGATSGLLGIGLLILAMARFRFV